MARTRTSPSIAFDDEGEGEPALLLLLGWCVDRSAFADLAPACSAHRRVLALDWRGHGESDQPTADFDMTGLVEDALAVVHDAKAQTFVPVALAHAGWVALELRRRLATRVPAVVLIDWLVLEAPPPFLAVLGGLQDADAWLATRELLYSMWLHTTDNRKVVRLVRETMSTYGFEMWARGAREVAAAYRREGSPLRAFAALDPPVPALHLYAQPADPAFLHDQQRFAQSHPWYSVRKVNARSHFPMLEVPREIATSIEAFVTSSSGQPG
jgi:pimeloyl-ACP methyl ester carboxylesterase